MTWFFLQEDFDGLSRKIQNLIAEQRIVGRSMGESTRQGAETFHDNAPFDAAQEHFGLLAVQLRELVQMRENARILDKENFPKGRAGFGKIVTVLDVETEREKCWQIGSYRSFAKRAPDAPAQLSYTAPLAQLLQGAVEGEERKGIIGKRERRFRVVRII